MGIFDSKPLEFDGFSFIYGEFATITTIRTLSLYSYPLRGRIRPYFFDKQQHQNFIKLVDKKSLIVSIFTIKNTIFTIWK